MSSIGYEVQSDEHALRTVRPRKALHMGNVLRDHLIVTPLWTLATTCANYTNTMFLFISRLDTEALSELGSVGEMQTLSFHGASHGST